MDCPLVAFVFLYENTVSPQANSIFAGNRNGASNEGFSNSPRNVSNGPLNGSLNGIEPVRENRNPQQNFVRQNPQNAANANSNANQVSRITIVPTPPSIPDEKILCHPIGKYRNATGLLSKRDLHRHPEYTAKIRKEMFNKQSERNNWSHIKKIYQKIQEIMKKDDIDENAAAAKIDAEIKRKGISLYQYTAHLRKEVGYSTGKRKREHQNAVSFNEVSEDV
jgi:hypothetical protein